MTRIKTTKKKSSGDDSVNLQEFRKPNEVIGIRLSQGRLSFLSRKVFNVLVFHAQKGGGKGAGAPFKSETSDQFFWIPLSKLARDTAYDSNDVDQLKASVQEMQDFRVIGESSTRWVSERLLASVQLFNPNGLGVTGGAISIGYAFPPEVENMVLTPNGFTKIAIFYQSLLRRNASLALYENCRKYATNPSKVTNRNTPEWWYHVLTGAPISEPAAEYRYFKRDTIKPAIEEINAITDIEVELIEHCRGRKVLEIQFGVKLKQQPPLALEPVIDMEIMHRMMALGLSQDDAMHLLSTVEHAKIRANLEITEKRMASSSTPLASPAAYFRKALQDNYASATDLAKQTIATVKAQEAPSIDEKLSLIREKYLAARAKEAYGLYREIEEGERDVLLAEFKASDAARGVSFARGLASTAARTAFSMWYAAKIWPAEPTDSDLLRFAAASL